MWANQDTGAAEVVGAQIQVEQLSKKAKVAWERAEVVWRHLQVLQAAKVTQLLQVWRWNFIVT